VPLVENKAPKSESAPYAQPTWSGWLKPLGWLVGITLLVLAFSLLLPVSHRSPPIERFLLGNVEPAVKYYSREHNGLWATNWAQMTNTLFRYSPRLYNHSLFLPDHYVFIPHDQNWEIRSRHRQEAQRIIILRSSPKTEKGRSASGRYAIVFSPSEKPERREFEVEWFEESEITKLLTQSGYSLPPLQKHGSRTQWLSERKQRRLAQVRGMVFLAILLLTPIACLIAAYHFVKHHPIG